VLARFQDSIALSAARTQIDDEGIALPVLRIRRIRPVSGRDHELMNHLRRRFRLVMPGPMRVRQVTAACDYG